MLFIVVLVIVGLVKRQQRKYWLHVIAAVFVQNLTALLFAAGGTLENPDGDGNITAMVRGATNDGPEVAALAIVAIGLGWAVPIWLAMRGYSARPGTKQKKDETAQ